MSLPSETSRRHRTWDFALLALLAGIAGLHRLAWSDFPPDVDPINFTVALHHYDVFGQAPHAPGYPLFVLLGRIASHLVGPAHAYQLVNLGLLCLAAAGLYLALRSLDRPAIGFAAAALLVTHPLVWSTTSVAESYIADGAFGASVLAAGILARHRPRTQIAALGVVFLIFGFFRPVSCFMLLPFAVVLALVTARMRWQQAAAVAIACGAAIGSAYVTTVAISGGLHTYRMATTQVMGDAFKTTSMLGGAPLKAHAAMVAKLAVWTVILALPAIVLAGLSYLMKRPRLDSPPLRRALLIGAAWAVPPLGFFALIYYLKPPYHLIYLPGVLIVVAWCALEGLSALPAAAGSVIVAAMAALQLSFFFFQPPGWPMPLHRLSTRYIREQDQAWRDLKSQLAPLTDAQALLLWFDHPRLSPYALRVLDWPGGFAAVSIDGGAFSYLEPARMIYSPPQRPELLTRWKKVVVIRNVDGESRVSVVSPREMSRVTLHELVRRIRR